MNCDLIPERNHPIGTIGYLISTVIVVIIIVVINNRDDDGQRESERERCKTFYATPPPATVCRAEQQATTKEGSIDRSDNEPFSEIALSTQHVAVYTSRWNGLSRVLFAIPNAFYYTYAIYDQFVVNGRRRKIDRSIGRSTRACK